MNYYCFTSLSIVEGKTPRFQSISRTRITSQDQVIEILNRTCLFLFASKIPSVKNLFLVSFVDTICRLVNENYYGKYPRHPNVRVGELIEILASTGKKVKTGSSVFSDYLRNGSYYHHLVILVYSTGQNLGYCLCVRKVF